MSLRHYLVLLIVGTLACWSAWFVVLFNIDPKQSGFVGLAGFYASLFLAALGTLTVLGFVFRKAFSHDPIAIHHIGVAVRQGLFLALAGTAALLLLGTGMFTWWAVGLLVAGFTLLEFFFLTRDV